MDLSRHIPTPWAKNIGTHSTYIQTHTHGFAISFKRIRGNVHIRRMYAREWNDSGVDKGKYIHKERG